MCGIALGYANALDNTRIAGIIHSRGSCDEASCFALRGVFFALSGVFGVVGANTDDCVADFRGVSGTRADVGAGSALSRYV